MRRSSLEPRGGSRRAESTGGARPWAAIPGRCCSHWRRAAMRTRTCRHPWQRSSRASCAPSSASANVDLIRRRARRPAQVGTLAVTATRSQHQKHSRATSYRWSDDTPEKRVEAQGRHAGERVCDTQESESATRRRASLRHARELANEMRVGNQGRHAGDASRAPGTTRRSRESQA